MTDHGLMMTPDNVRRILDLLKTMTRRVPAHRYQNWKVGDRIYIKETYYQYGKWVKMGTKNGRQLWSFKVDKACLDIVCYRENPPDNVRPNKYRKTGWYKRSAMFMPKCFARIWAEIVELREEPLQDISVDDCIREGMTGEKGTRGDGWEISRANVLRNKYSQLWDSLNNKRGFAWADNPIVKVIGFKLIAP